MIRQFDLCLTDMNLPDGNGLNLVEWIQTNRPDVPVAVITAHGNVESAVRALKLGAFDFVSKPLDLGDLRKLVASAIKLGGSSSGETTAHGPRLLGNSDVMQTLREMISKVARSQAPVHIFGESGTGKELVAQLIHESSAAPRGPVCSRELRRHTDGIDGERALRSQARQLHRRGRRQERTGANGRGRHSLSR